MHLVEVVQNNSGYHKILHKYPQELLQLLTDLPTSLSLGNSISECVSAGRTLILSCYHVR